MKFRPSQQRVLTSHGFTMLELLVTSAIVMIITGITLAGYLSFQARQEVQQATRDVQQLFVQARQRARDRDQTSCGSSEYVSVLEYNIKLQNPAGSAPASVSLYATCQNSGGTIFSGSSEDIDLPSSVSFDSLPLETVSFGTLEGGVSILDSVGSTPSCASSVCTVKLSRDAGAHGYQFTISTAGEIGGIVQSADGAGK